MSPPSRIHDGTLMSHRGSETYRVGPCCFPHPILDPPPPPTPQKRGKCSQCSLFQQLQLSQRPSAPKNHSFITEKGARAQISVVYASVQYSPKDYPQSLSRFAFQSANPFFFPFTIWYLSLVGSKFHFDSFLRPLQIPVRLKIKQ